jgi:hypothetical protein
MPDPPPSDALGLWRELLALRLPNPLCPMCAGSEWRQIEETATVGIEAIGLACTTCGFIRLHARDL